MSQTSYPTALPAALPGLLYDLETKKVRSKVNGESVSLPFGIGLAEGAATEKAALPAAATDKCIGISMRVAGQNNLGSGSTATAILAGDRFSIMRSGSCYAQPEQTVAKGDPVYMRFATSVNDGTLTQKGSFRKDPDGVAQVTTLTPTAGNSSAFSVRVKFSDESYTFTMTSDGSGTATEIVTGLKTAMAADAAFTARVVATGTTTLILTGQTAGEAFTVTNVSDGVLAVAATTPAAPTASKVKGARWGTAGTASTFAVVDFDDLTANS